MAEMFAKSSPSGLLDALLGMSSWSAGLRAWVCGQTIHCPGFIGRRAIDICVSQV